MQEREHKPARTTLTIGYDEVCQWMRRAPQIGTERSRETKARDGKEHNLINSHIEEDYDAHADAMDAFTLEEALDRATMPFEYVHRAESRRLEREEEADKIWA